LSSIANPKRIHARIVAFFVGVPAESEQRGFIIAGNDQYLKPYQTRASGTISVAPGHATQMNRLDELEAALHDKLEDLKGIIEVRRYRGF
jgi:CHASE3 domain sensor protein